MVIIAALVMTFARSIGGFIAGQVLAGAGRGVAMPIGPIYIEKLVHAQARGKLMSIWQIFYGIGNKIATYIALRCVYSPHLGV